MKQILFVIYLVYFVMQKHPCSNAKPSMLKFIVLNIQTNIHCSFFVAIFPVSSKDDNVTDTFNYFLVQVLFFRFHALQILILAVHCPVHIENTIISKIQKQREFCRSSLKGLKLQVNFVMIPASPDLMNYFLRSLTGGR